MTKIKKDNNSSKKLANQLLSLQKIQKIQKIPKIISSSDANIALLLHRHFNLDDYYDDKDYEVEILCTFFVGKTKMSLVHFVGYSMDYDQIIPVSKLKNFIK
jgi:hypothetical protein